MSGDTTEGVFFTIVAPTMGVILGNAMFFTPFVSLSRSMKAGALGNLNPLPLVFILCNCIGWVGYGYATRDYFIFAGNFAGSLLGLFYTLTASGLAGPADQQLGMPVRPLLSAIAVFYMGVYLICGLVVTCALDEGRDGDVRGIAANVFGFAVMPALITMYASPLSTIARVLSTGSSASIDKSITTVNFINASSWTIYGAAIGDYFIGVPNFLGVLLGAVQIALKLTYPDGGPRSVDALPPGQAPPSIHENDSEVVVVRLSRDLSH